MGNDVSSTRKRFSSRHVDDDATTTSKNERTGEKLKFSDAVGILIDSLCGEGAVEARRRKSHSAASEEEEGTVVSLQEDIHTVEDTRRSFKQENESSKKEGLQRDAKRRNHPATKPSQDTELSTSQQGTFCYFTKNPIGPTTPHYQGIHNLAGNVVYMLPAAMDLKGCPTICDEDLRKMELKYPNLFMRLPDELLLSSGWKRVSKFCSFSGNPIPDGSPFFHSKPGRGFYYLLASAIGMTQSSDVEPLTRDLLILLQTDFPTQCDAAPPELTENPDEWVLVDQFCFFSGGPIHPKEDIHYVSKLRDASIYMLAFLSPNLSAEELYRLNDTTNGLKTVQDVLDVEHIYDLTELDFHELQKYHLGRCRELPGNLLGPKAWKKVLPQHFMIAREKALQRASQYELKTKTNRGTHKDMNNDKLDQVPSVKKNVIQDTQEVVLKHVQHKENGDRGSITNMNKYKVDQVPPVKTDVIHVTKEVGLKYVQHKENGDRGSITNMNQYKADQVPPVKTDAIHVTQEVGLKYVQHKENGDRGSITNMNKYKADQVPAVKTDAIHVTQEANEVILPPLSDRPLARDQVMEQDETAFRDIQEEGAFTRLHPLDEIVTVRAVNDNFQNQILQGSTSSANETPSKAHVNPESNEEIRSDAQNALNNASPQDELLTSYIESSEALTFDYEQELSLGSDIGNSFSSLNSTPARDTETVEREYYNGMTSLKDSEDSHVDLHQPSRYHTLDADYEKRFNMSSKDQPKDDDDDHGVNGITSFTQSSYSNENRDIDLSDEDSIAEHNQLVSLEEMERNDVLSFGQGGNERYHERAVTDPSPSSAMRVAQELLRKNRLKRQVQPPLKSEETDPLPEILSNAQASDSQSYHPPEEILYDHGYEPSDTQSDTSRSDKNARRALILQLAKSRIKNQKAPGEKPFVD